jgi:biotin carboxyl carrier protein
LTGFRQGRDPAPAVLQWGEVLVEAAFDAARPGERLPDGSAVVFDRGEAFVFSRPHVDAGEGGAGGDGQILAPMPGRITSVAVSAGQAVSKGQTLATLEAMKMEHGLVAPFGGTVVEVRAAVGDQVTDGALLVRLEAPA